MNLLHRAVNKPRTLAPRKWLFQIHLWVGLFVGLYAIAIGVSGTILVFREEIVESSLHQYREVPTPRGAPLAAGDEIVAAVRKASGHKGTITLKFPREPGHAIEATFFTGNFMHYVFVDPYTGRALAEVIPGGAALRWLDTLHSNFFLKRTGRVINGIGGLLLVLLALTGICIWWPGRRLWRRRLTIDFRARLKRLNWDIHHSLGFWGLAAIVIVSFSGVYFTWPRIYSGAVARYFPLGKPEPPPRIERRPGAPRAPIDAFLAAANQAVPEGGPVWRINIPGSTDSPVRVLKRGDGDPAYRTATTITLDPYTSRVLRVDRYADHTTGDKIVAWIGPLHIGNFGGFPVKLLYALTGLLFPTLFITGFIMWWDRVARRRLRALHRADSKEAAAVEV
ncbi:MAG: PepSY domain-containing protein [Bryobacterales bacterium]|nr:PepSY domain-containing protein [Bryobacterales bacterium]